MTSSKEQCSSPQQNAQFLQAEQMIKQAIASMGSETHIEYGSTMERKSKPSNWKKWFHQLRRLRK